MAVRKKLIQNVVYDFFVCLFLVSQTVKFPGFVADEPASLPAVVEAPELLNEPVTHLNVSVSIVLCRLNVSF